MSDNCNGHEVLKVEINHLKEEITEIKINSKENNKYFREVIDSLKENSIQQTLILKNQERQFTQVNDDIAGLRQEFHDNSNVNIKWYQSFLDNNFGKVVKTLIIVVLIMTGMKLAGADISQLIKGL